MHQKKTWALVADGSRARILRNLHMGGHIPGHSAIEESDEELAFVAENLKAGDYGSDKPGRAYASAGSRRSSMEPSSDPVRLAEQDFAVALAYELEDHRKAGDFERLALIAAPQMLGDLRSALVGQTKDTVVAEIAKDLTKVPEPELRETVVKLLQEYQTL